MDFKIVFRSKRYDSGYEELHGSGCYTKEDMEKYCIVLGQFYKGMKVVPVDFNVDDPANKDYEEPKQDPVRMSAETKKKIAKLWDDLMADNT
jgi:hypothetical protein